MTESQVHRAIDDGDDHAALILKEEPIKDTPLGSSDEQGLGELHNFLW